MSDARRDPDAVAADLATTLRDLRTELRERERRPRFRPPTPRELLRFTDEYTIPALVASLEAAIRTLELLRGAIRLVDGRAPASGDRPSVAAAGRATMDRLDALLADLQTAVEGEPSDPEARQLLDRARELRDELDEHLDSRPAETGTEVPVDVESELQSIKDQLDEK
ncbi:MAG: hypothetical protein ABEJ23_04755 [Haloarculaceae archaeon]